MGFKRIKQRLDNGLPHGPAAFPELAGGSNASAQAKLPNAKGSETPTLDLAAGSVNIGYGANELEEASDANSYTDQQMGGSGGVDAKVGKGADHNGGKQHGGALRLGAAAPRTGKKKAVLVGNSQYTSPDVADLKGVSADLNTMAGGLSGYDIATATDQTRGGIAASMSAGMDGLERGDHLVLYYAGHGVPAGLLGVEVTPSNVAAGTLGVGEIVGLVNKARSAGFHLTAVLDSCHAGSVADAVRADQLAKLDKDPNLPAPAKAVLRSIRTLQGAEKSLRTLAANGPGQAGGRGFVKGGGDSGRGFKKGSGGGESAEQLEQIWTRATIAATEIGVFVPGSKVAGLLPAKNAWMDSETTDGARMDAIDAMANRGLQELQGLMPQS